jgi:hypothetical protein
MDVEARFTQSHVVATRMHDPQQLALEQIFDQKCMSVIRRGIVPLFAENPNSLDRSGLIHVVQADPLEQFGTGTLFQKRDVKFLITAAHIFPGWQENGREVRIGFKDRPRRLNHGIERCAFDPELDVCVIRLNSQAGQALLADQKGFHGESVVSLQDGLEDGKYLVPGYLAHKCSFSPDKQTLSLANFHLWTKPIVPCGDLSRFGLLEFPTQPTFCDDTLGATAALPTVAGLSGANVWRICQSDEELLHDWQPSSIRVVGVQVSELVGEDGGWIKCALWKHVMPLVDQLLN